MLTIWPFLMLMLLLSGEGMSSHDLVALVDADDYFKAHKIEVKVDTLVELAGRDPEGPKGQVAQLLALRWLGEHADQARKVKQVCSTVQQIADGKKAQDQQGFARDYARRTLALLDGKPAPRPAAIPANSVAREGLKWFPGSASIFGACDLRASGDLPPADESPLRSTLAKISEGKKEFYEFVDSAGNMRLDRVAFAYTPDPQNKSKGRIYVRFTGLADRKALADFIKKKQPNAKVAFKKGPKGLIMVISSEKRAPAYALIGDTDLLMCRYEGNEENSLEVLEAALDVQAGNKPGILKGAYAAKLKKVPADAAAVFMGGLSEDVRRQLAVRPFLSAAGQFGAAPKSIVALMTRTKSIHLDWNATMADAGDAKEFADNVASYKKLGIDHLKRLPPQEIKPEQVKVLTNAVEAIKAEAKDATVQGGVEITPGMIKVIKDLLQKPW